MRNLVAVATLFSLFLFSASTHAQGCDKHRQSKALRQKDKSVEYKCYSPCDVMKGVGCYLKDATCRVGDGLGTIITAPFKAKACFPEPERWRYTPPSWKWSPPRWEKLKYPDPVIPDIEIYDGEKYHYPLHKDAPVEFSQLVLFRF